MTHQMIIESMTSTQLTQLHRSKILTSLKKFKTRVLPHYIVPIGQLRSMSRIGLTQYIMMNISRLGKWCTMVSFTDNIFINKSLVICMLVKHYCQLIVSQLTS